MKSIRNIPDKSVDDIKKALERDNFMTPDLAAKEFWLNRRSSGKKILRHNILKIYQTYHLISVSSLYIRSTCN